MIRGKKKTIEKRPVLCTNINASIHNRFDIEVVDAKTGMVKKKAKAYNVICSNLWSQMLAPGAYFQYIHYGSGSGTPSAADTQLFNFSGAKNTFKETIYNNDPLEGVASCRRTIQLNPEEAVGVTITEIGIAYGSGSGTLCTHAMLQDMNGNQVSIEKTDTDVINIYATVFLHYGEFFGGSGVTFPNTHFASEENTTYLLKWLFGVDYSSSNTLKVAVVNYGASNAAMRGTNGFDNSKLHNVTASFDSGNKTATFALTRIAVDKSNLSGGIIGIVFYENSYSYRGSDAMYLSSMGNWWPGSLVTGEAVGTGDGSTTDFSTKYSLPQGATVYVDGVATPAQVSNEPLRYNDMGIYFTPVELLFDTYGYGKTLTPFASLQDIPKNQSQSNYDNQRNYSIFYNPFYSFGIKKGYSFNTYAEVSVSDDLNTWDTIPSIEYVHDEDTGEYEYRFIVPDELKNKKYWKIKSTYSGNTTVGVYGLMADTLSGKNIHFDTPPADGAVITADYTTKVIAKDDQHVFDLTVTMNFKEYTE